MKSTKEMYGIRWLWLFSLLGTFYCLANAFGAELFCETRGCDIYAGYGLFGISFYWYGFAGFLGLFLLSFFKEKASVRPLLSLALGLALLFDGLFLVYQSLLWPCSSCHVVALLIGLAAFVGIRYLTLPGRKVLLGVGIVWSVFFVYVSIAVVKELAFPPWALYGSGVAPVKVYFSPTCSACEEVVSQLLADQKTSTQTALYPVAKNSEDEVRLARLMSRPDSKVETSDILQLFSQAQTKEHSLDITSRLRLLSNKMTLARSDSTKVPLIISPHILNTTRPEASYLLPVDRLWGAPAGQNDDSGCSIAVSGDACDE